MTWTRHGEWKSRVLDYDPALKRTTHYFFNEDSMQQRLVETWDVNDIVEENKAIYAQTDERAGWKGEWHHVGKIPMAIAFDVLKKTGWGKDRKSVSKWLTDPENRHFLRRPISRGI